ncbi:F0F1 ATP synthase subunit A [Candidatus Dependentiae bacterium]
MKIHIFDHKIIRPLSNFGFTGAFWDIHLDTLWATAVAMILLLIFTLVLRIGVSRAGAKFRYAVIQGVKSVKDMVSGGIGVFDERCFSFVVGITMFTLFCNLAEALPYGEAATGDVNTTLAIGIICFSFVQLQGMRFKKWGYFSKYFYPIFLFFPINLISQLSKVASLSFRLFGNILGGSVILALIYNLYGFVEIYMLPFMLLAIVLFLIFHRYSSEKKNPIMAKGVKYSMAVASIVPFIQIIFCLLEGILQAGVIGLLTTIYLSSEVIVKTSKAGEA